MTERRTYYANPEDGDDQPQPGPPPPQAEGLGTKAWGVGKSLLLAGATAVAAVVAVDLYRKYKRPAEDEQPTANPGGITTLALPGAPPSIVPFPMPWPMPMGGPMMGPMGGYGMGGYGMGNPHEQAQRNIDAGTEMTPKERIELARLEAETAKSAALKAQMDAFMAEDD